MSSRKERQRAERDELILRVARELLLEKGYLGLTMDRIAKATEYSKGTIYQHYSCKEEVVIALAIQTAEIRGTVRQRILGDVDFVRRRVNTVVGKRDIIEIDLARLEHDVLTIVVERHPPVIANDRVGDGEREGCGCAPQAPGPVSAPVSNGDRKAARVAMRCQRTFVSK